MKFGIRNLFGMAGLLLAAASAAHAASDADPRSGLAVVERLYKDYGWQAIVAPRADANSAFGKELNWQSKAVLETYFDPALAALIVQDANCKIKTHELCQLEFDPIFSSQDPSAADLRVKQLAPDRIAVEFRYPSNGEMIHLEYLLGTHAGQRRIVDVVYRNLGNASLKTILQGQAK